MIIKEHIKKSLDIPRFEWDAFGMASSQEYKPLDELINKVDARLYHPKALGKVKIVYALQEKNIFQIMYKSIGESMIIFNNTIKIHANTSLMW